MLPAVLIFSTLLTLVFGIPTISVKGSKFFTSDGNQFFVKGIAYQLVPEDPLIDGTQCTADANLMKTLGTNAIRVYHVDPTANHTPCMNAFSAAGIYVFIDLDTFTTAINQDKPEWNETQLQAFEKVMDAFHSFDNVAGFFIGNEVITTGAGSPAAPYVKAATRDLKSYRDSKGYRNIPVGYSAADIASLRPMLQNYLACGSDAEAAIDFFSLNAYEWCGASTYQTSGYAGLNSYVQNYSIPIFFSETGCNTAPPRTFTDQAAIFGPEMSPYWSGSIIYEWIQENNAYGLISYGAHVDPSSPNAPPDGWPRSGTPQPVQPDFDNLKSQWAAVKPSSVSASAYTPSNSAPACPASTAGTWVVDANAALPGAPNGAAKATGTSATSGSSASSTAKSSSASRTTASTGSISVFAMASTTTAAVVATTTSLGSRTFMPMALLLTVCWLAIGGTMPF
ncbi:1,3-beta-glucanosyltransferase gel3 precursor [Microthyrium microscopicum]|uniref:1,3-beta-glucanosyltransferase n=1 Tax=Microthyrium microscopicum TaxID=703497 RepID=A0A6A6TZ55_9PEZI|nr:1,3-beta-glucanosyltransferase gel3 precursor [Microthyrium microscopicum]